MKQQVLGVTHLPAYMPHTSHNICSTYNMINDSSYFSMKFWEYLCHFNSYLRLKQCYVGLLIRDSCIFGKDGKMESYVNTFTYWIRTTTRWRPKPKGKSYVLKKETFRPATVPKLFSISMGQVSFAAFYSGRSCACPKVWSRCVMQFNFKFNLANIVKTPIAIHECQKDLNFDHYGKIMAFWRAENFFFFFCTGYHSQGEGSLTLQVVRSRWTWIYLLWALGRCVRLHPQSQVIDSIKI